MEDLAHGLAEHLGDFFSWLGDRLNECGGCSPSPPQQFLDSPAGKVIGFILLAIIVLYILGKIIKAVR